MDLLAMAKNDICCFTDQSDRTHPDLPPARPVPKERSSGLSEESPRDKTVTSDSNFSLHDLFDRATDHPSASSFHHSVPYSTPHGPTAAHLLYRPKSIQSLIQKGLRKIYSRSNLNFQKTPKAKAPSFSPLRQSLHPSLLDSRPYDSDAMAIESLTRRIHEKKNELHSRTSVQSIQWSKNSGLPARVQRVDSGSTPTTPTPQEYAIPEGTGLIGFNEVAYPDINEKPSASRASSRAPSPRFTLTPAKDRSVSPATRKPPSIEGGRPTISIELSPDSVEVSGLGISTSKPNSLKSPTLLPRNGSQHLRPTSFADSIELSPLEPLRCSKSRESSAGVSSGKRTASGSRALSVAQPSSSSRSPSLRPSSSMLRSPSNASQLFEKAVQAAQAERSAMYLPAHKDQIFKAPLFRERSASVYRHRLQSVAIDPLQRVELPRPSLSSYQLRSAGSIQSLNNTAKPPALEANLAAAREYFFSDNTVETGVWSRYPSHTRYDRTECAGALDKVDAKDFADVSTPEPGILRSSTTHTLFSKRLSNGRFSLHRNNSFNVSRNFLKNWANVFRSQSREFRQHGHGHRSSVTTGGVLEYPELEILAPVFTSFDRPLEVDSRNTSEKRVEEVHKCKSTGALQNPRRSTAEASRRRPYRRHDSGTSKLPDSRGWAAFYASCVDLGRVSRSSSWMLYHRKP